MHIHIFQHVPFEGPGYIAQWAAANGHPISYTRFYEAGYVLPALDNIDALVIMGGPMSVYDEHIYPWLIKEKAFIEDTIQAGKKVLGICLGAQLIAVCLGAFVPTALNKEIGWFPVSPTVECCYVPWFNELFRENPVVFHWHGDKFDIPYGAYDLLSSAANSHQAFMFNEQVLGLQFHPEMTPQGLADLVTHCEHELQSAPFIQDKQTILQASSMTKSGNVLMEKILQRLF